MRWLRLIPPNPIQNLAILCCATTSSPRAEPTLASCGGGRRPVTALNIDQKAYPPETGRTGTRVAARAIFSRCSRIPARWKPNRPMSRQPFEARFRDELACARYLDMRRWPDGFVCFLCGSCKSWELKWDRPAWKCADCGRQSFPRHLCAATPRTARPSHAKRTCPAVFFQSFAHIMRPLVRRPQVISSRGLSVCGGGCRSR